MDSQTNGSPKIDLYKIVTDEIMSQLEQGAIPWQKPWNDAGIPMNLLSKRPYRGINLWLLLTLNYERNLFLTWEQIKSVGGSVLKGEHGHIVVFWKPVQKKAEEQADEKDKAVPMLRYYKVYNIGQCRDIPEHLLPVQPETPIDPIRECESILNNMPDLPNINYEGKEAYYHIVNDEIVLPKAKSFRTSTGYYGTLFHELVHSTGAEKRLNRKTLTALVPFGSESYAVEELVAEMGAAYLCGITGLLPNSIKNTVSYIDNWLGVLKNDKRLLITAAGQAQKAVDFILNRKEEEMKEEPEDKLNGSVVG
jgi:antirestriction protein ArdC